MSFAEERRQRKKMLRQSGYGRDESFSESLRSNEQALKQCETLNNDIDHSLDRVLMMTNQTTNQAADTLSELRDQREQIKRIHQKTCETEEVLHDCDRSLKSISSWKEQFKNKFRRKYEKKSYGGMQIEEKFDKREEKERKDKKRDKKRGRHKTRESQWESQRENGNDNVPADWKRDGSYGTTRERKVDQIQKKRQIGKDLDVLMQMAGDLGQELRGVFVSLHILNPPGFASKR